MMHKLCAEFAQGTENLMNTNTFPMTLIKIVATVICLQGVRHSKFEFKIRSPDQQIELL